MDNKTIDLSVDEISILIQALYNLKDTLKDMSDLDEQKLLLLGSTYTKLVNA